MAAEFVGRVPSSSARVLFWFLLLFFYAWVESNSFNTQNTPCQAPCNFQQNNEGVIMQTNLICPSFSYCDAPNNNSQNNNNNQSTLAIRVICVILFNHHQECCFVNMISKKATPKYSKPNYDSLSSEHWEHLPFRLNCPLCCSVVPLVLFRVTHITTLTQKRLIHYLEVCLIFGIPSNIHTKKKYRRQQIKEEVYSSLGHWKKCLLHPEKGFWQNVKILP